MCACARDRSLRTLRALRPLRVISRLPSMQLVIEALLRALPEIMNVTLVLFVVFLVFAICGVQSFGGTLASCMLYVPPPLAGGTQLLLPMTALTNRSICLAMSDALDAVATASAEAAAAAAASSPSLAAAAAEAYGGFELGSLCAPPANLTLPSNATRCRLLWHRDVSGFDHVGEALLTLMEIATLQGWARILQVAMGGA